MLGALPKTLFQSTPLREGQLPHVAVALSRAGFNPRPYVRGDCERDGVGRPQNVSIHAPT